MMIFTDAATSPQTGISIGAYLCLNNKHLEDYTEFNMEELSATLANMIVYKQYASKKSTWSEIKTVIDALGSVLQKSVSDTKVSLYTDCQSVCDLLGQRKEKLERNCFITRSGKIIKNVDIYKELYSIAENFQIEVFKIKGHGPTVCRLTIQERIFAVLDKLSRKKLRVYLKN